MNHFGDEHPPAADARAYLPTEIEQPYRSEDGVAGNQRAADVRPYLPTEIEAPYPSADSAPGYQPTFTGPGAAAPSYSSGRTAPHTSGHTGPTGLTRFGPGVPVTPPASVPRAAERIWRTGHADQPSRLLGRWRRRAGAALTAALLAASAVVLYARFHHAPFHVTAVSMAPLTRNGCSTEVTGEISTNGAAGTVSYQWLFQPDGQTPQPLSKSVAAGQGAVYVTIAVRGSGHGTASRTVTLQVLGPDIRSASIPVMLRC